MSKPQSTTWDRWDEDGNKWRHFRADLNPVSGIYNLNLRETDSIGLPLKETA
jgi:hypothetical protein